MCNHQKLIASKTFLSIANKPPAGARISKGPAWPLNFYFERAQIVCKILPA